MHLNDLPSPTPWHVRLFAKIAVQPEGCWLWTASCRPSGYGQIWSAPGDGRRRLLSAHRAVYELARGPIPDGLDLDHLCRNRKCVNPEHLEPVTRRVNILRGTCPAAQQARRTHCAEGHLLVRVSGGRRGCLTCRRERRLSAAS